MYMQVGMLNLRDHCACVAPQLVLLQWWLQAWWLLWWLVSYIVLFNSPFTLNDNNLLHCRFYTNQLWDECKAQCRTRNNTGSGTITFYFYVDNISNCPDVCYIYQFLLISHCKCIGSFLIYSHSLHSDLNRKLHTFMQVDIGLRKNLSPAYTLYTIVTVLIYIVALLMGLWKLNSSSGVMIVSGMLHDMLSRNPLKKLLPISLYPLSTH